MINRIIAGSLKFLPVKLIWKISRRYIAGESLEDALSVCRKLNSDGFMVTVDLLGENITNLQEAEKYKTQYIDLIKKFTSESLNSNFSVKPSMFGLHIDLENCTRNLCDIVKTAKASNTFIRIDMEDSSCTDDEITIFKNIHKTYPVNVGLVLQAYLKRTFRDLKELSEINTDTMPLNIRLCKGIYIENESISYKEFHTIRKHFMEDLNFLLKNGIYTGIATHDRYLIDKSLELLKLYKVPKTKYEFQMLYGVTPRLAKMLLNSGHRIRIYVPFGAEWLNYSIRRLNENPKIISHILKAFFIKE